MTYDQVLHEGLQLVGKSGQLGELRLQHLKFNHHVAEKLPFCGVCERAVVGEFVDLPDVMQKSATQQEIAVDFGIIPANQITRAEQGNHVIEQTADIRMVERFRCWGIAVSGGNLRIRHESLNQSL